jgi:TPR repeat protein
VGQYNFGWMYEHGRGAPQEDEEAVKWYRLAADQGDADAQFILGEMYMEGNGVSEDFEESMRWCRLAADQGHAKAKGRLALLALFEKVKGKL